MYRMSEIRPPMYPNQSSGMPKSPPPGYTPTKEEQGPQLKYIAPGSIKPCTFQYVYIWPTRGYGFWAWLIRVDKRSISGWKWMGRRWTYFGMDLRKIDSFICY